MGNSIIEAKSFDFAIRIVKLYQYLCEEKKEFVLSKQLLRSGTSIGANVSEGERGQTKPDFNTKMSIALKEANETGYWLELLYKTNYITEAEYKTLDTACTSIRVMLISSINTAKENSK